MTKPPRVDQFASDLSKCSLTICISRQFCHTTGRERAGGAVRDCPCSNVCSENKFRCKLRSCRCLCGAFSGGCSQSASQTIRASSFRDRAVDGLADNLICRHPVMRAPSIRACSRWACRQSDLPTRPAPAAAKRMTLCRWACRQSDLPTLLPAV